MVRNTRLVWYDRGSADSLVRGYCYYSELTGVTRLSLMFGDGGD
jgi:hypothetical protein